MVVYLLAVYMHVLATIFWVGYILFWAILIGPLASQFKGPELARVLKRLNGCSWPPGLVPIPYRLKLPGLGWTPLVILVTTGVFILYYRGMTLQSFFSGGGLLSYFGQVLTAKLVLLVGLIIGQSLLVCRPSPRLVYLELLTTVLMVALSVLLVR